MTYLSEAWNLSLYIYKPIDFSFFCCFFFFFLPQTWDEGGGGGGDSAEGEGEWAAGGESSGVRATLGRLFAPREDVDNDWDDFDAGDWD